MYTITEEKVKAFEKHLYLNEKAAATVEKYTLAVKRLAEFLCDAEVSKARLLKYRQKLQEKLKAQTVNAALVAINVFLDFCGLAECKIKLLKVQRQVFLDESKELCEDEYKRLLAVAKAQDNERLHLLMLTIGSTGIRIGELHYITVETAVSGRAEIYTKGKNRMILLQKELRSKLLKYAKDHGIESGHIFRTKSGRPLDRANINHEMKRLCTASKVDPRKVFPHSFRHLFARVFYAVEKNLAHLADVLGHSRIETTRIYVAVSATTHERILNRMKLVV